MTVWNTYSHSWILVILLELCILVLNVKELQKLVFHNFRDKIDLIYGKQYITQKEVTTLFREFGSQIRKVKLKWSAFNTLEEKWPVHKVVSNLIEKNSGENLRNLSIYQFLQNEDDINNMLLSIINITQLKLVSCVSTLDVIDLLNNYQLIEELILNSYGHWNEPIVQHYCTLPNVHLQKIILRYNFPLSPVVAYS